MTSPMRISWCSGVARTRLNCEDSPAVSVSSIGSRSRRSRLRIVRRWPRPWLRSNVVAALSDYEAHPVAIMEALSLGRPVVGYDIAGTGELVSAGWVRGVSPGTSASSVARALVDAFTSPLHLDPAELPTWDSCAAQLAQIYLTTVRRHPLTGEPWTSEDAKRDPRDHLCSPESPPHRLPPQLRWMARNSST